MITIKFLPDSDLEDFSEAIRDFEKIWERDGEKIVSSWEDITGLKFKRIPEKSGFQGLKIQLKQPLEDLITASKS